VGRRGSPPRSRVGCASGRGVWGGAAGLPPASRPPSTPTATRRLLTTRVARMEIERIVRARLEPLAAHAEVDLLDDLADALPDARLVDVALALVDRRLGDHALRIDRPLDVDVPFDPRVIFERLVVASARFVAVRQDDRLDVLLRPPGLVGLGAAAGVRRGVRRGPHRT